MSLHMTEPFPAPASSGVASEHDLDTDGLDPTGEVHWNLSPALLYERALARGEGRLAHMGGFVATTAPPWILRVVIAAAPAPVLLGSSTPPSIVTVVASHGPSMRSVPPSTVTVVSAPAASSTFVPPRWYQFSIVTPRPTWTFVSDPAAATDTVSTVDVSLDWSTAMPTPPGASRT